MFGRWVSVTFREFLRLGDLQYRHLCDMVSNSASLAETPFGIR